MFDNLITLNKNTLIILVTLFIYCLVVILVFSQKKLNKRSWGWLESYNKKTQKNAKPWWKIIITKIVSIFSSSDREMRQKFLAAGFYDTKYAVYFMPIKYTFLIITLCGTYWLGYLNQWEMNSIMIIMTLWLVSILILPDSYLAMRSKNLKVRVSNKLPYLIDLLAVCVQTGMTIEAAMNYLSKEITSFDKDLGVILNKTNDRTKIIGLEQALEELYIRVPSNEMRSFVMTINQSLQYGTSIYHVLTTLSADIREVQILSIEESIGKLSAKMSIPLILFIMFPIIIIVAAPGVLRAFGA